MSAPPDAIFAEIKRQIEKGIITKDTFKVQLGKCTWYHDAVSHPTDKIANFADFVNVIVHTKADNYDATCFDDYYGILYSLLYMVDPDYIQESARNDGIFCELAARLALLIWEYNSYAAKEDHSLKDREYFKYTNFAIKRVCIHIITELAAAVGKEKPVAKELEATYDIYPQVRKSLPLTSLLVLAMKYLPDPQKVKEFSAEFIKLVEKVESPKKDIKLFYNLGRAISQSLEDRYGSHIEDRYVPPVKLEVAEARVAESHEIHTLVQRKKPTKKVVISSIPPEKIENPAKNPPKSKAVFFLESAPQNETATTACQVCDDGRPHEVDISLTEGRFAGESAAAVDYALLKDDSRVQGASFTAWQNIQDPQSDKQNNNASRIVNFIDNVLYPMRSIEAESVTDLAFTLATLPEDKTAALNVLFSFLCNEFITDNFSESILRFSQNLKAAMHRLFEEKPIFAHQENRLLFTELVVRQFVKQLLDADETESRPKSDRYKPGYGMIAHIVGNIYYVQRLLSNLFSPKIGLRQRDKRSILADIKRRIDRRFFDAFYAARLICESAGNFEWSKWRDQHLPNYMTIHVELMSRLNLQEMSPFSGEFKMTPMDHLRGKKPQLDETTKSLVQRAEYMDVVPLETAVAIPSFAVTTPRFAQTKQTLFVWPEIGETEEKQQEMRILAAISDVRKTIADVRSTHRRREMRQALREIIADRAFLGSSATYTTIELESLDYSCGGVFRKEAIPDMQAFLSKLYIEQNPRPVSDVVMVDQSEQADD